MYFLILKRGVLRPGILSLGRGKALHLSYPIIRKEKPIIKTESAESLLGSIRDRIAQGYQVGTLQHLLNRWLKIQLSHGRSLDVIATGLNEAGIPTLSGAGHWRADTVQYLVRRMPQSAQVKRS